MNSFLEKLKKGMGVEEIEEIKEEIIKPTIKRKRKTIKIQTEKLEPEPEPEPEPEEEEEEEEEELEPEPESEEKKQWSSLNKTEEGQLAIDVFQTENDLIIQSTIAGVDSQDIDVSIERDIVTIRGNRKMPVQESCDYLIQECFWGPFSREIIMPVEVDPQRAVAEMKKNVLIIRIPKVLREKKRKILVN